MNKEIPNIRFSGFREMWNEKHIKNMVNWMRSGGTPKSDNDLFYSGNIAFISIPDMNNKYLITSKKFISELVLNISS